MKRRNVECGKLRRPVKRNKIAEGISGNILVYLKFLLVWGMVLLADFLLEFRFEYLWPFWLLLSSVYDSYRYQGLAFSVFFIFIAITSDMICYLFIPIHWLFFAASTYVWVQYVWHTERGICAPTIILWLIFVYIEASVRLKELKNLPFYLDLCRPFAAHCIGYPVVTLGFGFKSYIGYKIRQRKQKDVSKENEFYIQLLQQALPPKQQYLTSPEKIKGISEKGEDGISNGVIPNGHTPTEIKTKVNKKIVEKEREKEEKSAKITCNGTIHKEEEYIEKRGSVNHFDENELDRDKSYKSGLPSSRTTSSNKWSNNNNNIVNAANSSRKSKNRDTPNNIQGHKDEYLIRLETDMKRLKADLQMSRQLEVDLRSQVHTLMSGEKSVKNELIQLQHDNESLQNKLHGLVTARQNDKQTISGLEKKLQEERKCRALCEAQLAAERKAKKSEEAAAARALAIAATKTECPDSCKGRRREMDLENKQLRRDLQICKDRYEQMDREVQSLRQYKENNNESEVLMSALQAMQDKNVHLEKSLSAETRLKLDLFSALGKANRDLEIKGSLLREKEEEVEKLKTKIADVVAISHNTPFSSSSLHLSGLNSTVYTNKMTNGEDLAPSPTSTLDPNATAYTPKCNPLGDV